MSSPWCFARSQINFNVNQSWNILHLYPSISVQKLPGSNLKAIYTKHFGQKITIRGSKIGLQGSFVGGSSVLLHRKAPRFVSRKRVFSPCVSWVTSAHIASDTFTLGTVAILPFYTLMVLVPNAKLTKRTMESSIPYIVLGTLYAYLVYLSWTPDTLRLLFASENWLPELPSMLKMFSSEMTTASVWIHLLVVDLFAARQIFHDGLQNNIETRHSISLCMLCCPIGIVTHAITKVLSKKVKQTN